MLLKARQIQYLFQETAALVANVTLALSWYDYMCHISNIGQTRYLKLGVRITLFGHFSVEGKCGDIMEVKKTNTENISILL